MTKRGGEPKLRRGGFRGASRGRSLVGESPARTGEAHGGDLPSHEEPRTEPQAYLPLGPPRPPLLAQPARLAETRRGGRLPSLSFLALADPLPSDYYLG